jgi:hypothetical protein
MALLVLAVRALGLQRVERLLCEAPPRSPASHDRIHGACVHAQVGDPTAMWHLVPVPLPTRQAVAPQVRMGRLEWQVPDTPTPLAPTRLGIVSIIIGDAARGLGCRHGLAQGGLVRLFAAEKIRPGVVWQPLARGGSGTQTVCGDQQLAVGVVRTQLAAQAFGGGALTSGFLRAILLHNGLGHEGKPVAPIGVEERGAHQRMGLGHGAMAVVPLSTRCTRNRWGGKIARALEGDKGVPRDKHHLLKRFAALQGAHDVRAPRTEEGGLNGVAYLAHRGIPGHPLEAIDPWSIALGALLVKGQQRGCCERKQGTGGHARSRQRHVGVARALIGKGSKATAAQAA